VRARAGHDARAAATQRGARTRAAPYPRAVAAAWLSTNPHPQRSPLAWAGTTRRRAHDFHPAACFSPPRFFLCLVAWITTGHRFRSGAANFCSFFFVSPRRYATILFEDHEFTMGVVCRMMGGTVVLTRRPVRQSKPGDFLKPRGPSRALSNDLLQ